MKAFQSSVGIDADGVVRPVTWLNIDEADQSEPILKKGSRDTFESESEPR